MWQKLTLRSIQIVLLIYTVLIQHADFFGFGQTEEEIEGDKSSTVRVPRTNHVVCRYASR